MAKIRLYCPICGKSSIILTLEDARKISVAMQQGKIFLQACKECGYNTTLSKWTIKQIKSLAWSVS